mmetsp:Transcript_24041/g.58403  ORF Transcript_24041/g.58403 Transcript_24041/m.58403 type:complete len:444 (+) Transcript_24041:41-1372(+)
MDEGPRSAVLVASAACLCYFLIYFTRTPIMMLPDTVTMQTFVELGSTKVTFQQALSIVFTVGFAIGKVPAIYVISSQFFFSHKLRVLLALNIGAAAFVAVPYAVGHEPGYAVCGLLVSTVIASAVYGAFATYMEGRRSTEAIFAVMNFSFIFAGSASRGTASAVLDAGVSPELMPLVTAGVALPFICGLLVMLDRSPKPGSADVSARGKRAPMSSEERAAFLRNYAPGIFLATVAYTLMTAIRQYRDMFSRDLMTAAHGGQTPSSVFFFFVDLPGALVAMTVCGLMVKVTDNVKALLLMLAVMATSFAGLLLSTMAFKWGWIGGELWQVIVGIAIFTAYVFPGGPFYDRLVGAAGVSGTCSFMIFVSDLCGYAGTLTLLFYSTFKGQSSGKLYLNQFVIFVYVLGSVTILSLVGAAWYFAARLQWRPVADKDEGSQTNLEMQM